MKKRVLWRILNWCVSPLRWGIVALIGLCFLYALAISLNVPQYLINAYLQRTLPADTTVTVGTISRAFPFSFRVDEIALTLPNGEKAKVRGLDLRWGGIRLNGTVDEIVWTKGASPQIGDPTQTALQVYEAVRTYAPSVALLKYVQALTIQAIHSPMTEDTSSVQVRTIHGKKLIYVKHIQKDRALCTALSLDPNGSMTYKIVLQKKAIPLWHCQGQLTVDASCCHIQGHLQKTEDEKRTDEGTFDLTFVHDRFPSFLTGEGTTAPLLSGTISRQDLTAHIQAATDRTATLNVVQKGTPNTPLVQVQVRPTAGGVTFDLAHEAPSTQLSFHGTLMSAKDAFTLNVQDVHGRWKTNTVALPSVRYDLRTKQLDLSTITVNQASIQATRFSLNPKMSAPNTLTFPVKDLTSKDQTLDFGRFSVTARVILPSSAPTQEEVPQTVLIASDPKQKEANRVSSPSSIPTQEEAPQTVLIASASKQKEANRVSSPSSAAEQTETDQDAFSASISAPQRARLVVSFALKPHPRTRKPFAQTLGLGVQGDIILSRKGLSLQNFVIESGSGARCEGDLTFQASSLFDLVSGLRRTFLSNGALSSKDASENVTLSSSGTADVRSRIQVFGHLHGTLSLTPIAIALTTGDRISGKVTTDLCLGGTLEHPLITGPFTLAKGYYENVNNGIILKNVSLEATGDGDQMVIHEIRLTDGTSVARKYGDPNGPLAFPIAQPPKGFASGYGSLRFWTPEDATWKPWLTVRLRVNTMQVTYSQLVKGRVSGDIVLEGSLLGRSDRPVVTGDATVDGMLVTIETTQALPLPAEKWTVTDRKVHPGFYGEGPTASSNNPSKALPENGPAYRQFALDVTLKGEHILVQDEALRCFLIGTMVARGPLPTPHLVGTMTVDPRTQGTYDFLGKRLTVVRGTITYDEEVLNDPILDVTLKITLSGSDIFVTLSGRLSHVNIALRANPAMSNEEILSLLLFGQGMDALSPNQNVQVKAFASQMLQGDGNPLGFLDHLRGKLKLDSLEILETQDLESGETKQSVRFGKSLKKAHIYFGQDLSSKTNTKVTLRYDLTSELGLEANLSTLREASGVGVQWLRRY